MVGVGFELGLIYSVNLSGGKKASGGRWEG